MRITYFETKKYLFNPDSNLALHKDTIVSSLLEICEDLGGPGRNVEAHVVSPPCVTLGKSMVLDALKRAN